MRIAAHRRRLKSLPVAANEARRACSYSPLRSAPPRCETSWRGIFLAGQSFLESPIVLYAGDMASTYGQIDDEFRSIPFAVLSAHIKLAKEAENYAKLQLVERASVLKEAASLLYQFHISARSFN